MFDIYSIQKHDRKNIEFIMTEVSQNHVDEFFKLSGFMTKRTSRLNRRFEHIKPNVRHVGFTEKNIFLIVDSGNIAPSTVLF